MVTLKAIVDVTRFHHAIAGTVAALTGGMTVAAVFGIPIQIWLLPAIYASVIPLLLVCGAMAINDAFDVEVDIANDRQDRPLVRGELDRNWVFIFSLAAIILGTLMTLGLSIFLFLLTSIASILIVAYSAKPLGGGLKDTGILGNIVASSLYASPYFLGGYLAIDGLFLQPNGNLLFRVDLFGKLIDMTGHPVRNDPGLLFGAIFMVSLIIFTAFFIGMCREILKDVWDVTGDTKATIARTRGTDVAARVSTIFCIIVIIMTAIATFTFSFTPNRPIIPFSIFLGTSNSWGFAIGGPILGFFVLLMDLILLRAVVDLLKDQGYASAKSARSRSRIALLVGCVGFFIGAVINVSFHYYVW